LTFVNDSNVELVRRLFDLYASGGIEAALEVMSEEVVIVIPAELSAEPDTYRGHDGVRRYFAGFDGMIEDVRYEAFELIPEGSYVLARARLAGRGTSSGVEVDLETVVAHAVQDGEIVRIQPYADLDSARAALG
jgi:ketosteroid isomerase-like protein